LGIAMGSAIPASPYEWFTLGTRSSYTITGGITTTFPAHPAFDLRQEGNDPALSTPINQPNPNRGQVCFHNLNSQAITFNPIPNKAPGQLPFTVAATASSGLTVAFSASGHCFASGLNGSIINAVGLGTCTVTAYQPGNATYAAAPNVARTFSILPSVYLPLVLK
jgi:hypothetical protein